MIRRIRIRFGKEGDLRFISHRDLVRAFERMLRRAGLTLAMSQGFHPRPKMTFPDALALGVEARNEVAEVVVTDPPDQETLRRQLAEAAPPGLRIHSVRIQPPQAAKARVLALCYEYPLPVDRLETIQQAVVRWQGGMADPGEHGGPQLAPEGVELQVCRGALHMRLWQNVPRPLRPQQVLAALGLIVPDQPVTGLIRSDVQLVS